MGVFEQVLSTVSSSESWGAMQCALLLITDMAVAGEHFHVGPGHRVWFPLSCRCDCTYNRSFGCTENVYHVPSRHCWSRKCLKYISGLAPCNTQATVVCGTLRYTCSLLIQNCSTLSVHITAQSLQGHCVCCYICTAASTLLSGLWMVYPEIGCYAGTLQRG